MNDVRETWREFNRRIAKEGRTEQFRNLKERMLLEGKAANEAQARRMSAKTFHPLDGSAHEFFFTEHPDGTLDVEPSHGRHGREGTGNKTHVRVYDPETAAIQPLIDAMDPKKLAGGHESIQWAFDQMLTPWTAIDPETVPGIGALSFLKWARSDPKNMTAFYGIWSKMLEKRSAIEEDARRRDDGRKTFSLLDDFLAGRKSPGAPDA